MADPQAPFDPGYMTFLQSDAQQRHDDYVDAATKTEANNAARLAMDGAHQTAMRAIETARNDLLARSTSAQEAVAQDIVAVERRQEVRLFALALIKQRVVANTVVGPAGISFGTARRVMDDALLYVTELDRVAPV